MDHSQGVAPLCYCLSPKSYIVIINVDTVY